jgi:broad specificity phosphatase PhoE
MNHLADIVTLHNRYIAVRHGESEANVAHVISSHPDTGIERHGLTSHGRIQVTDNSRSFRQAYSLNDDISIIVSSDFRRARETADILALTLFDNTCTVQIDVRLRERYFGRYDGQNDENYASIWTNDRTDPTKNILDHVETVDSVRERTTALINELESKYRDRTIFLVSHGDSLQILQTAFERMPDASKQRDLPHLDRGEFRVLELK